MRDVEGSIFLDGNPLSRSHVCRAYMQPVKPASNVVRFAARLKSCAQKKQDWKFNAQSLMGICGLPPISQSARRGRGPEQSQQFEA